MAEPPSDPARRASGWHEHADAATLAQALAGVVARQLEQGVAARGAASLLVSGGRTPALFFAALARADLVWERVSIGLSDERWVAPASADSNEHLLRTHLLTGAARRAAFLPLKTGAAEASGALAERWQALQALARPIDAVVLGMGEDGHIASLFPGAADMTQALDPAAPPALVAVSPPAAAHRRISFNLAALLEARRIFLLIQGEAKRAVLERARRDASSQDLPVAALFHQSRVPVDVYWTAAA